MKKQFILQIFLIVFLTLNVQSQEEVKKLVLNEDENIRISLLIYPKADIGDSDWLQLEITNKSEMVVKLTDLSYFMNEERFLKSGEKAINYGSFGKGNMWAIFHDYLEYPIDYQNGIIIDPNNSILAWKYLTNYASALIDGRNYIESELCALFDLDAAYEIYEKQRKMKSENSRFCFKWINSENVPKSKLIDRLRKVILNPYDKQNNIYITSALTAKEEVVSGISTNEIIKGILLRKDVGNADETILLLTELSRRKSIPNARLTEYYEEMIIKGENRNLRIELKYYWDNSLLDDILESNLHWSHVSRILELSSRFWSIEAINTQKVYGYLSNKLNFHMQDELELAKLEKWSDIVKILSISRNSEFIEYLREYLDNESEFSIEDFSKCQYSFFFKETKPDLITIRVCDIAFVAILRALNQFEFGISSRIGTKHHSLKIKTEILNKADVDQLKRSSISWSNIDLILFEKELRLTPELKNKVKGK